MLPLQINELLCFLTQQFKKIERDNLISTLIDAYTFREALEAKTTLVSECNKISVVDSIKDFSLKRQEGKSGALRRVITDTVDIWTVVDQEKAGELLVQFVAANPNRLPNANVEKFNVQYLIAAVLKLQEKVEGQDASLSAIRELLNNRKNQINPVLDLACNCLGFLGKGIAAASHSAS